MSEQPWWNRRNDGSPIPEPVLGQLDRFESLRARALLRLYIAQQDRAMGDYHMADRNEAVADEMFRRSWEQRGRAW